MRIKIKNKRKMPPHLTINNIKGSWLPEGHWAAAVAFKGSLTTILALSVFAVIARAAVAVSAATSRPRLRSRYGCWRRARF